MNHIAKAVLRAAYSVLIRQKHIALNSYNSIYTEVVNHFPEKYKALLLNIYKTKIGEDELKFSIKDILVFLKLCEEKIADTPKLKYQGLAYGRGGESFAFPADELTRDKDSINEYNRFSGFENNYHYSFYFLFTALEIFKKL